MKYDGDEHKNDCQYCDDVIKWMIKMAIAMIIKTIMMTMVNNDQDE